MFHKDIKLSSEPRKLTRDTTLLENQKCIIKATAGTLTLRILIGNDPNDSCGHFFLGRGQLTLDAIIETPRGAVGESIVKDLTRPFLMLSRSTDLSQNQGPATSQDLADNGYSSVEEFLRIADHELDLFTPRRRICFRNDSDAHVFAFKAEQDKWDILMAEAGRLVYRSVDKVYISKNRDELVVAGPAQVW